ncbi:MAG TPA: sigma-70 family RNA polymerase sigma factor [Kofleriaceae bacterium]|jgi:RNA polymerase sigma-70 factor (ECF subfamily)
MADEDLELLDRWIAGDASAGNQLFKRNFALVYRFFETKTEGEIEDLVQETFLACLKSRATFQRQSTFRTYLLAIARHTLFHYWRKRRPASTILDFEEISVASLSTSVGSKIAAEQERAALLAALREMPLDQQLLIELYYWEDLDRDALAAVFDVEPATIGTRLFRARQQLREHVTRSPMLLSSGADIDGWIRSQRATAAHDRSSV